jgi:hypothetical protein
MPVTNTLAYCPAVRDEEKEVYDVDTWIPLYITTKAR